MLNIQLVINILEIMLMELDKVKENTFMPTETDMKVILKIIISTESENLLTKIKENIMVFVILIFRSMVKWSQTWLRNLCLC